MDNVVLTPHIGGATLEARHEMVTTVAKNIVDFLQGRKIDPKYIVNPEVLPGAVEESTQKLLRKEKKDAEDSDSR